MYGPDISNNQGTPNYAALFASKPDFVFAKASEGTWFHDGIFPTTRSACSAAKVPVGAYHFARPDRGTDPIKEADFFAGILGHLGKLELRPALDMEVGPASHAWATAFCAEVEKKTGVKPLLYTYPDFYRRLGGWPAADTWIADLVSPGKSSIPNVLHQYTWTHSTPGVGSTDYNYAAGLEPLLAYPVKPLSPVEEKFLFFRWYLGEGEFAPYGKHNRAHRPAELRARIPRAWWVGPKGLVAFLAARKAHRPTARVTQGVHTALRRSG